MAPKGKKKKAAEQAAELERLAEEQRLAEIAEQERLEKERLEKEEQERLRKEEEARLQAELDARLVKEGEANAGFYAERERRLLAEKEAFLAGKDWKRYVACLPLPDTASEASVNEALTEWRDKPGLALEATLDDCELAHQVLAELRAENLGAREEAPAQAEWQARLGVEMGETLLAKLDQATAEFLQVAETHANSKNECQLCLERPSLKFGLWVNLAKNPRVKQIDFAELQVQHELPKSLALASVAIRALQYTDDRYTDAEAPTPDAGGFSVLMTLGGVLALELLGLPPTTKKVKGWTLRQVSEHSAAVVRQQYPAPGGAGAHDIASAPQLKISYAVPPHVVVPSTGLTVGCWEAEGKQWSSEGVSEVAFEVESRILSFNSARLTAIALLQPSDLELPYKQRRRNWLISPSGRKACRVTVETQRHLVEIDVDAGGATLRGPKLAELAPLLDTPLPPSTLLLRLKESGLNLMPSNADINAEAYAALSLRDKRDRAPKGAPKLQELERTMHEQLAPLLCSLQVAPSRWSEGLGEAKALYRVAPKKEAIDLETGGDEEEAKKGPDDPFAGVDGSWQTVLVKHPSAGGGTALVKALDSDAACDEGVVDGMEAHSTPLVCLEGTYPELLDELKQSPMLYQDTVRQLLNGLRLFSFTLRPEPPKEEKK